MTSSKVKKPVSLEQLNSWRMHRQFLDHSYPSKNVLRSYPFDRMDLLSGLFHAIFEHLGTNAFR